MRTNQKIAAIETRYNGINFRSRLEAKWAAMFDLLKWGWTYEPTDFNGWIPDFAIHKIDASGCHDEVLIVGMLGPMRRDDLNCPIVGWLREGVGPEEVPEDFWWEPAPMSRYEGEDRIGFCHSVGSYRDRITGQYDGGSFGSFPVTQEEVTMLWREASNRTRWNPKQ